jgi:hypothetical protein
MIPQTDGVARFLQCDILLAPMRAAVWTGYASLRKTHKRRGGAVFGVDCHLSLAAPWQSARLQTSVKHFLWGAQRGGAWPPRRCQPCALSIPVIALLIVLLRCEMQRAIG